MTNLILGVFIGVLAYLMQYIGKGLQKLAIEGFKEKEKKTIKAKHSGIWIIGVVMTGMFVFIQWIPLTFFHIPMNLIAPLEGIGLIVLLLFSHYALKEQLGRFEFIGIVMIITGTVLINLSAKIPIDLQYSSLHITEFWIILGTIIVFGCLGYFLVRKKSKSITGIILGLISGCCMAFQTLSKRLTDINELSILFTFVTFFFAILTLVFSQLSFSQANANIVIPSYTSASIIMTSLLGLTIIEENISIIQYIGIGTIIIGVIFLSGFRSYIPSQEIDDST